MLVEPGTILAGKYRCERELGAGAMGRVYAATHLILRQRVALKVLTNTTSPNAVRRFLREARLAHQLTSIHVTRVYDAGELDDGIPYIAMELLDGVDLAKLSSERGPLPPMEACHYIAQACAGIAEAHTLGMVHRDIKLANLFLAKAPEGSIVKVLDFGCAKVQHTGATSIANATSADVMLGTPRFMAPEQIVSSRDVDARADVWSIGVVLYTLLAGRPPFRGDSLGALMECIVLAPAPPIAQALPVGLVAILDRCLQKQPEHRFANAAELGAALLPFAREAPITPARVPSTNRARYYVPIIALASTCVGGALFVALKPRARDAVVETRALDSATSRPPTASTSDELAAPVTAPTAAWKFDSDLKPADSNTFVDRSEKTEQSMARVRADRFCSEQHVRECFKWNGCMMQASALAYNCRNASDTDACFVASVREKFAPFHVQSAECKDLE